MKKTALIQSYCRQLKLSTLASQVEQIAADAATNSSSYLDFALSLLEVEIQQRQLRDVQKRLQDAQLPLNHQLENYDFSQSCSIAKTKLNQLKELSWMEQNFNLVLSGPSGTGKSFIAAGLCYQAIKSGYRAYFRGMDKLMSTLKMKDITRSAKAEYRRLSRAHLIVIDDIMTMPAAKQEANSFFHFINDLFEKTSFIITTNKSPQQWVEVLGDEVLTTALLDRILYRCEIIQLTGESYRMQNRKTIFENQTAN